MRRDERNHDVVEEAPRTEETASNGTGADESAVERRPILKALGAGAVGLSGLATAASAQEDAPPVLHAEFSLHDSLFLGNPDLPPAGQIDYSPDEGLEGELGAEIAAAVGEVTGTEIAVRKTFCARGPPENYEPVEGLLIQNLTPPELVRENPEEGWQMLVDAGTPQAIDEKFVQVARGRPETLGPRTSFLTDRIPSAEFTAFDGETVEETVGIVTEITGREFRSDHVVTGYASQIVGVEAIQEQLCEILPWFPWCNDGPRPEEECLNLCRSVCPTGWWARISGVEQLCYNTCDSLCDGACRLLEVLADRFGVGGDVIERIAELVC